MPQITDEILEVTSCVAVTDYGGNHRGGVQLSGFCATDHEGCF